MNLQMRAEFGKEPSWGKNGDNYDGQHVHPGLLQKNVVHGGVLASIADSACAVAAISKVFPESVATTI